MSTPMRSHECTLNVNAVLPFPTSLLPVSQGFVVDENQRDHETPTQGTTIRSLVRPVTLTELSDRYGDTPDAWVGYAGGVPSE